MGEVVKVMGGSRTGDLGEQGREPWGADGVDEGFCFRRRGRRGGEKGEWGEWIGHVYGSDDDSGGEGFL
jgi:hypothetical protein